MTDKTLTKEMQRIMAFFYVATIVPKEHFKEGINREKAMSEIMKDFDAKEFIEDMKKLNEDKNL